MFTLYIVNFLNRSISLDNTTEPDVQDYRRMKGKSHKNVNKRMENY